MVYEIAGVRFSYTPLTSQIKQRLAPFCSDEKSAQLVFTPEQKPTDARQESVALLRWFSLQMLQAFDGMLVHAVALGYRGRAYIFVAPSGTGKTTHAKLWQQHIPGAKILNGDKPFLRCVGQQILVFGSPWQGKENYGENMQMPLAGIFLLRRGEENRTETLQPHQALSAMMNATVVPQDGQGVEQVLRLMEKILGTVPVCRLFCTMDAQAPRTALAWIEKEARLCE